ncbi:protein of unknown function [Cyanobium sp. NIES-981]|nr:protein of unknown function [Cyanobium sp. NIES-981]
MPRIHCRSKICSKSLLLREVYAAESGRLLAFCGSAQ